MEVSRILEEIDSQISKLQQARELLSGTAVKVSKGRGRPKGSKNARKYLPQAGRSAHSTGERCAIVFNPRILLQTSAREQFTSA